MKNIHILPNQKDFEVWLMSSNTPHETLLIDQGKRRTFMRVTLAHNYDNTQIFQLEAVV